MTILESSARCLRASLSNPARKPMAAPVACVTALACLLGLGSAPAVLAQQAAATSTDQPSGALEEVVVTAERRDVRNVLSAVLSLNCKSHEVVLPACVNYKCEWNRKQAVAGSLETRNSKLA